MEEQKEGMKISIRIPKINLWMLLSIVLAIGLVLSLIRGCVTGDKGTITGKVTEVTSLSAQEAGKKCVDYINNNLVQAGTSASMVSVEDLGSVYRVITSYQGNQIPVYITKDGKYLSDRIYDTSKEIEQPSQQQPQQQEIAKVDKPSVKFFVMSFCPYGQQAESGLEPVATLLGSKIEMEPHYVIYSNYRSGYPQYCLDKENKYCSMHGIQELNEDVRQLCVYKYNSNLFWKYVKEINSKCSSTNVDSCWEAVATSVGIDTNEIKTCQQNEAVTLLSNEVLLNQKYNVRGSPMVFINDVEYQGGRSSEAYKQAVCSGFTTQPKECSQILSTTGSSTTAGGCE